MKWRVNLVYCAKNACAERCINFNRKVKIVPLFGKMFSTPRPIRMQYASAPVATAYLPAHFRNLPCRCDRHGMPVPLRFAGWGKTLKGYPTANYACPLCSREEAYGRDFTTGEPRLLFSRG